MTSGCRLSESILKPTSIIPDSSESCFNHPSQSFNHLASHSEGSELHCRGDWQDDWSFDLLDEAVQRILSNMQAIAARRSHPRSFLVDIVSTTFRAQQTYF